MKDYIRLARPAHWMKNILVLLPLLCSGHLLEPWRLWSALWGLVAFSLMKQKLKIIRFI